MHIIKDFFKDKKLIKYSVFVVFTMLLIYIMYFLIKNFDVIIGACAHGIGSFLGAIVTLFIGILLAYIINPAVEKIDEKFISRIYRDVENQEKNEKRQRKQRLIATLITYVGITVAIVVLIYFFTSLLLGHLSGESITKMLDSISAYIISCEEAFKDWVSNMPSGALSNKLSSIGGSVLHWLSANFNAESAIDGITGFGKGILNFVLGIIVSFWLVLDKDFFKRGWNRFFGAVLPGDGRKVLNSNLKEIDAILSRFIRGILLDAVIIAVLSSIALSVFGLKYAVFIGIFAGLCNVIPYFGPVMGMIPAFIVGLINGGLLGGIIPVVILLIIQQVDSNFIYPKVVGSSIGLHPVTVLLAVVVGGVYGGIIGMLIAVPIASIIKLYVLKLIRHLENKKQQASSERQAAENSERHALEDESGGTDTEGD